MKVGYMVFETLHPAQGLNGLRLIALLLVYGLESGTGGHATGKGGQDGKMYSNSEEGSIQAESLA